MKNYQRLVYRILSEGAVRDDRTGVGTLSLFGTSLTFDLQKGFPATTCKRLAFTQVCAELACFLRGYDTLEEFHSMGCRIWDRNAQAPAWMSSLHRRGDGDLGRIYGVQWRRWQHHSASKIEPIDQLGNVLQLLKNDPWSRRAVVSAWKPDELDQMCLPPCHTMFQFSMRQRGGKWALDCMVTMRSVDVFLGMPFDIASYALLTTLAAADLECLPGVLSMHFGDTHLYRNHEWRASEMVEREVRPSPDLVLLVPKKDGIKHLDEFHPSWATLVNYDPHPSMYGELNV